MSPYTPNPLTLPIRTTLSKLLYFLAGGVLIAVMLLFAFRFRQVTLVKWAIALSPLILMLLREFYRWSRRNLIRRRRFRPEQPYAWRVETATPEDIRNLFPVDMSIIRNSNLSLLLLIDKVEEEDHQAHLYELFYESLRNAGITLTRFYHKGDLQVYWNEEFKEGLKLEQLAEQYKDWQPVFCGDGHRAVNHEREELHGWTFHFYKWKKRILLTNRPTSWWDYQEAILKNCFTVIPLDREGIFSLANFFSGQSGNIDFQATVGPVVPELNENDPQLIEKLEASFGPAMTRWVAATSLSSRLDWDMTLKIGQQLSQEGSDHLLNYENLRQLGRIGWFRTGDIPDAARRKLAAYLDPATAANVRKLMVETLEESPPPPGSHAHNSYRMELAGLKALIPDFPQTDLTNELYELKSIGYQEDVLVTDWIDGQKLWFDRIVPDTLERVAYNEGFFLLGRSFWFFLPLLLLFAGLVAVAPFPDFQTENGKTIPNGGETPPLTLHFIGGQVTDIEGESIAGAKLVLTDIDHEANSDRQGRFQFEIPGDNDKPRIELRASAEGYLPRSMQAPVGDENFGIRLVPAEVTIHVEDGSTGRGIQDAAVNFENREWLTDASGNVRMGLPDHYSDQEIMQFTVEKPRYSPSIIEKTERIARQINVTMFPPDSRTTQIRGQVLGEQRAPLPNVQVRTRFGNAQTGNDGNFNLTVPEGEQPSADFLHRDYLPKTQPLTSGQINEIVLTKKPPPLSLFRFSGVTKDNCTGNVLPGVHFEIGDQISSNSRNDGAFSFQLQGPEADFRRMTIVFTRENYHPVEVPLSRFSTSTPEIIQLSPRTATGTVLDAKGSRVPDALVTLRGAGEAMTDRGGRFSFNNIPPNVSCPIPVSVEKSGYPSYRGNFMPGGQITLGEEKPANIEFGGRVSDACNGNSVVEAKVSGTGPETTYTNGGGTFQAVTLQSSLQLNVTHENYYPASKTYSSSELASGVKIQLTPKTLGGKVVDENGRPVYGAEITTNDKRTAATDDSGRFSLPHSEKLSCTPRVSVKKSGFETWQGTFSSGQEIRLSRQVAPYVVIYVQRSSKQTFIDAAEADVYIDGVYKGKTGSNGEIRINIDKQPGQKFFISVNYTGYPGINQQEQTFEGSGQRVSLKLYPVG